jgi:hypothetical protein
MKARCEDLARIACALFGNLAATLDHRAEKHAGDPLRLLLHTNATVAIAFRERFRDDKALPRILNNFHRLAAHSISISLYDIGGIDDRDRFRDAYLSEPFLDFTDSIDEDTILMMAGDNDARRRLGDIFVRDVLGKEHGLDAAAAAALGEDITGHMLTASHIVMRQDRMKRALGRLIPGQASRGAGAR